MCFTAFECHKTTHTAKMCACKEVARIFCWHKVGNNIKDKVVAADSNNCAVNFVQVAVKFNIYSFACFHTLAVLFYNTEAVCAHKAHCGTCTACKRRSNKFILNLANLNSHIFLVLERGNKALGNNSLNCIVFCLHFAVHKTENRYNKVFKVNICRNRITRQTDNRFSFYYCKYNRFARFDCNTVNQNLAKFAENVNGKVLSTCG